MGSLFSFISIIFIGAGFYVINSYHKMKQTGKVNEVLLVGRKYYGIPCKDPRAFIREANPAVLVLGIGCIAYGVIDFVGQFVLPGFFLMDVISLIGLIGLLVILIWFTSKLRKLRKIYFDTKRN